MTQQQFEQQHGHFWEQLAATLTRLETPRRQTTGDQARSDDFPDDYRRLCHHLALARQRGYSPGLVTRLNALVLRGHRQLYSHRPRLSQKMLLFIAAGFPQAVRAQWRWHLASTLAFVIPLALIWLLIALDPGRVHSVLNPGMVADLEGMYAGERIDANRGSDDDLLMFGYYIYNNIGVAFRSFAGGLFAGVGALFIMIFNGGFFGAVAGHLVNINAGEALFTFVIAHGAPEITAIILAGGAGLRLGVSLVAPGPYRRLTALRLAARECLPVIYGVFLMLVLAAFIEAFWSPRVLPVSVKYTVGALCWAAVGLYLGTAGRWRRPGP